MLNVNPGDAMDTTPFTQAIASSSTLPSLSQSTSASHPVPELPADFAAQPPPHTLLSDPAPAPPLPAAVPTIPSSFAAALHLGTLSQTLKHTESDAYVVPPPAAGVPTATGVVRSASMKVFTDEEWGKQRPEDIRDLKKIKFMREEEVRKMSVGELKKAGFGRGKTGEFGLREEVMGADAGAQVTAIRVGCCSMRLYLRQRGRETLLIPSSLRGLQECSGSWRVRFRSAAGNEQDANDERRGGFDVANGADCGAGGDQGGDHARPLAWTLGSRSWNGLYAPFLLFSPRILTGMMQSNRSSTSKPAQSTLSASHSTSTPTRQGARGSRAVE